MDGVPRLQNPRKLADTLPVWLESAEKLGVYVEYQIEGVLTNSDSENRLALLLDLVLERVIGGCELADPAERWISLRVQLQPCLLRLECAAAGIYPLGEEDPEEARMLKLTQYGDSYRLCIELAM